MYMYLYIYRDTCTHTLKGQKRFEIDRKESSGRGDGPRKMEAWMHSDVARLYPLVWFILTQTSCLKNAGRLHMISDLVSCGFVTRDHNPGEAKQ